MFSQAWAMTRRYKLLWLFGLLASLQSISSVSDITLKSTQASGWIFQDIRALLQPSVSVLLQPSVSITLFLIILWLIGLLGRAALIQAVAQRAEADAKLAGLGNMLRASGKVLWRLAAMQGLLWLPMMLIFIFLIQEALPDFMRNIEHRGIFSGFVFIFVAEFSIPAVSLVLSLIDAFAYRFIVLEGCSPWEGIRRSLQLNRNHLGAILGTGLGCWLIAFVLSWLVGLMLIPFVLPLLAALQGCMSPQFDLMRICMEQGALYQGTVLLALTSFSLANALINTLWTVFQSAVFTLLFRQISLTNEDVS